MTETPTRPKATPRKTRLKLPPKPYTVTPAIAQADAQSDAGERSAARSLNAYPERYERIATAISSARLHAEEAALTAERLRAVMQDLETDLLIVAELGEAATPLLSQVRSRHEELRLSLNGASYGSYCAILIPRALQQAWEALP